MPDDLKHLEALLIDMKESLVREMQSFEREMRAGFNRLEQVVAAAGGKTHWRRSDPITGGRKEEEHE